MSSPFRFPRQMIYQQQTLEHRRVSRSNLRRTCTCAILTLVIFAMSLGMLCGGVLLLYPLDPPPAVNILVLGNDTRPDSEEVRLARTDTVMIVRIDPPNKQISLLSIPRDLIVSSPNYGRIPVNVVIRNAELVQAGSGIQEMVMTLQNTFNIQIHHTMRLNFDGFVELIDAIGGIEIEVPKHIVDNEYPTPNYGTMWIEFLPGKQKMDGELALIYARTRHADDDYNRARRQQQVMNAVFKKLANPLNAHYWPKIWRVFEQYVESDLATGEIIQILPAIVLYGRNPDQINRLVIDRDTIYYENDQIFPDMLKLNPWLDQFMRP